MMRSLSCFLMLSACATVTVADVTEEAPLGWLTGCWQSEDGSVREAWSVSEGGYLFGYAVTYSEGQPVFFEQMRIDPGEPPVFSAYPRGEGPSPFPATETGAQTITFANPAHDYPQKVKYWRVEDELRATISLIDDSNAGQFSYAPCGAG
ncbi:MAG: DUF6265 family protein [Pseudomonadota bacterium]